MVLLNKEVMKLGGRRWVWFLNKLKVELGVKYEDLLYEIFKWLMEIFKNVWFYSYLDIKLF